MKACYENFHGSVEIPDHVEELTRFFPKNGHSVPVLRSREKVRFKTKLTGELPLPDERFITNVLTPFGIKYISFNTKNQTINIMKNSMKTLVVLAILAIAGLANAQSSANANATANATIICPISITNTHNLEFGTIVNGPSGGTETVSTADVASYTGTGVAGYTGSIAHNTPQAADFTVGGQGGFSYSITPSIVTNFGGTGATLGSLTSSQGASNTFSGTACTTNTLDIGGTITFTAAANGAYSATINVAVAYN